MGKKSRRQRPNPASSRPTFRSLDLGLPQTPQTREATLRALQKAKTKDDESDAAPAASTLSPERRAAAVAAAEAECRAAIAALSANRDGQLEVSKDTRSMRAIAALTEAVTLDKDDQRNFTAYLRRQGTQVGNSEMIIKIIKRWPRLRKYWPRLRRRVCWGCGKQYDLSEPRLWVCGGCGEARYCDEACQAAHWPKHQSACLEKMAEIVHKRLSEGATAEEIGSEFLGGPPPVSYAEYLRMTESAK